MAFNNPSVADFQTRFARDFAFGTDINTSILDTDILNAFTATNLGINPNFSENQSGYSNNYNLFAAHSLVLNLRASSQGINGRWNFLEQSKSVGSVSQSFAIPQRFLDNPYFSMLMSTPYGALYLFNIYPYLTAPMFTSYMPAHAV